MSENDDGHPVEKYNALVAGAIRECGGNVYDYAEKKHGRRAYAGQYTFIRNLSDEVATAYQRGTIRRADVCELNGLCAADQNRMLQHVLSLKMKPVARSHYLAVHCRKFPKVQPRNSAMWPAKNEADIFVPAVMPQPAPAAPSVEPAITPPPPPVQSPANGTPSPAGERVPDEVDGHRAKVMQNLEERWLNSCDGLVDEGVMPPEVSRALFGEFANYGHPAPVPAERKPTARPEMKRMDDFMPSTPRKFLPVLGGIDERKVQSVAWILHRINALALELKKIPGSVLEEVTHHPGDYERLRALAVSGADGLSRFEALLTTCRDFHG